jgi:hypothetical protein
MEHPPYSPDLALNHFQLFLKIEATLQEQRFQDTVDIWEEKVTALKAIPQ